MSSSGGKDRKSRSSKTQGWEEAGGEFYQESYPVGADWDGMQRDPAAIATLLPSKQNRYGEEFYFSSTWNMNQPWR